MDANDLKGYGHLARTTRGGHGPVDRHAKKFEKYMEGVEAISTGLSSGCDSCPDFADRNGWSCFSWTPCEVCASPLAGDRHPAHGLIDGELCHFEVCEDCFDYINGNEAT